MHSEAIGSVWTFSKIFEIFWIFESFFNVSGRNFYKRLFSRHNIIEKISFMESHPETYYAIRRDIAKRLKFVDVSSGFEASSSSWRRSVTVVVPVVVVVVAEFH